MNKIFMLLAAIAFGGLLLYRLSLRLIEQWRNEKTKVLLGMSAVLFLGIVLHNGGAYTLETIYGQLVKP